MMLHLFEKDVITVVIVWNTTRNSVKSHRTHHVKHIPLFSLFFRICSWINMPIASKCKFRGLVAVPIKPAS